ncbi:methyltransferase family protein [Janibacter limosus]|jgi:protein-S-isoprenylcysteine O-methyltransferase Ste14|uniref:methyltransferase family protein n=1 Tax=Janibacter limosus TaxID=53458 RepID=UPI0008341682|nr:isoprenylcysteine carboxylmethyltransferase family protein [Janibacter limosus]
MKPLSIVRSPPVLGLASLAAQRLLSRGSTTSAATSTLGAAVALAGIAVAAAGIREVRSAGTTLDPMRPQDTTQVVRRGVFRYSRNPIYLGDALLLAGYAIHRGDPLALIPVAGFVGVIDLFQVPEEEAALLERFGSTYGEYVATVRRWF